MTGIKQSPLLIAIFASGTGTNAKNIIEHSLLHSKPADENYKVDLIVCNNPGAGVLNIASKYHIDTLLLEKERFFRGDGYVTDLKQRGIRLIVLAGFLWKIPVSLISAYPQRIINIHPALLPKYGGKGMYGQKVHEAVIAAGDKESGITIHYVDEIYDHGNIIFRASCPVDVNDNADTLAQKIHVLEHRHYPGVIKDLVKMQNSS